MRARRADAWQRWRSVRSASSTAILDEPSLYDENSPRLGRWRSDAGGRLGHAVADRLDLLITTSIKYVAVVMRADNEGEGGILALMSLLGIKHGNRVGIIASVSSARPYSTGMARSRPAILGAERA